MAADAKTRPRVEYRVQPPGATDAHGRAVLQRAAAGAAIETATWANCLTLYHKLERMQREGVLPPELFLVHRREAPDRYELLLLRPGDAIPAEKSVQPSSAELGIDRGNRGNLRHFSDRHD